MPGGQQPICRGFNMTSVSSNSSLGGTENPVLCLVEDDEGPLDIAAISASLEERDLAEKEEAQRLISQTSLAAVSPSRRGSSASSVQPSLAGTNSTAPAQEQTTLLTDGSGIQGHASARRRLALNIESQGVETDPSSIMAEAYSVPDAPVFDANIIETIPGRFVQVIPWYKRRRNRYIIMLVVLIVLVPVLGIVGFSFSGLSGFVWTDLNKNGLFESEEPLMNGVIVVLKECDSKTPVDATVTGKTVTGSDKDGFFHMGRFADEGEFFLEFTLPFEQEDGPVQYGWTSTRRNSYHGNNTESTKVFRRVSDVFSDGQKGKTKCFTMDALNFDLRFNAGLVRMDTK